MPRNLSHVPQRLAFVAILAVSGVLIGSDSEAVYAGCFPEANRTVDVTTSNAEEHTDDTAVNGTAGNQTGVPNSAWADWGSARRVQMKAPTEKPPQGKKSCLSVGGFIYAWAEDGDQANISCDEWVQRDSSIWTVCIPVGNHVAPPNGGNDWLIETGGQIKIIVSANGDNDEDFSRSLTACLRSWFESSNHQVCHRQVYECFT